MSAFSLKGLIFGWIDSETETAGKKLYVLPVSGSAKNSGRTRLGRMIMSADDKLDRLLTYTSARTYGLFLLGFGLLSLLLHFAKDYLGFYEEVPLHVLVLGVLFSIIGAPFLLSDKPIAEAFASFPPTDYLFFEFFCIKRANGRTGKGIPAVVALTLGLMLAVVGAFVPMAWVAGGIGALVYLLLTVSSPEFSFFAGFLALPYLPLLDNHEIILAVMVGVTALSFLRKVALGKRVIYLEQYDVYIAAFILVVLTSGIFLKGVESFASSLLMAVLVLGYPMAGGMITNRRVADRAISAIVISSVPVSCYSVYCLVRGIFVGFEGYQAVSAAFDTPEVLAVYLIVVLVLSVYFVNARRSARKRALYTVISVLTLAALAATLEVSSARYYKEERLK